MQKRTNIIIESLIGRSLKNIHLAVENEFGLTTILIIGIQIIKLLNLIHERFIIHNDIKPSNICWRQI